MKAQNKVTVLDFGGQYAHLIAKRIRRLGVYADIRHPDASRAELGRPGGIILSGGPSSVYAENAPAFNRDILDAGIPILGLCYGMQLMAHLLGGEVRRSDSREYGRSEMDILGDSPLFKGLGGRQTVWMSHGDSITTLPDVFRLLASTANTPFTVIAHRRLPIYALQFHPEVHHSENGLRVLENFVKIAGIKADWTPGSFIDEAVEKIRAQVGNDRVILGLSGGVDSSVAAALLYKAIGDRLIPIFVDNGCMRFQEAARVKEFFSCMPDLKIDFVDANQLFLDRLNGVENPEQKRKIIGAAFIDVFEAEAAKYPDAKWLAQGTLYSDVIESVSFKGPSVTIKSHHNVGGLPEKMKLGLVEPLREIFKDEVRAVGRQLGLPYELISRHPFPGPGLAVRILGAVDVDRVQILQQIDEVFIQELRAWNLYDSTWQAFAVLLPISSVGVMGDERSYENVCALRAVNSVDGMTADWTELPYPFLKRVSNRIINEVKGVNRVVFDISSKPPATIEWE